MRSFQAISLSLLALPICCCAVFGQDLPSDAPANDKAESKFYSAEDGWLDVSGFLKEKYGFLPLVVPITEPAVGYGAAGGLVFLSKPLPRGSDDLIRPNITFVGGMGTENGTKGLMAADMRYWLGGRLQTLAGLLFASVNLDFHGIGNSSELAAHPLSYNIKPHGGTLQGKARLGNSRLWAGLSYAFSSTEVNFDAPPGTQGVPNVPHESKAGGLTPSLTYDSRDNIFTPNRGTYVDVSAGLFSEALGGDSEFQRVRLTLLQFIPLHRKLTLGLRGDVAASFGNEPFYLRPYIGLRGAPALRYQGEEIAQIETELRWQFWERFSVVGFGGGGAAWNHFEQFSSSQAIATGGFGFRYELAREYGIHLGFDLAFAPNNTVFYMQVGSAWARP